MKLSIIIPVYRVERTLGRCIESVLAQSFFDYEIILVDDGSPDNSPEICGKYAKQDKRIQVIHQENGGLSAARNAGIEQAKGEYITFVDSDDYIAPSTYQPLMEILAEHPEYDMLEYPVYVHKGSREQHVLSFVPQTYTDRNRYWLDTKAYSHAYAWNKIYRRGVFQNIRYPKGKLFEDVWIYPEILRQVGIIATTDKGMYIYTYNPDSITARPEGAVLKELLSAHLTKLEDQAIDYRYYAYLLNIQMDVYERTGDEPILPILPYWGTLKLALLHIIGLKKTCQLNKILHRLSRRN